jgi:hypothetical protein
MRLHDLLDYQARERPHALALHRRLGAGPSRRGRPVRADAHGAIAGGRQRFVVAYVRACRDHYDAVVKRDPALRSEVIRILVEHSDFKDPALLDRGSLHAVDPDGRVNLAALEADYRWYIAQGLSGDVVDLRQIVDDQFVEYAVQQLGPYPR